MSKSTENQVFFYLVGSKQFLLQLRDIYYGFVFFFLLLK